MSWLTRHAGITYRLPTEAEWEYAARGESFDSFVTGADIGARQANFARIYKGTLPAGSFSANRRGLFDLAGNVWELVQDCWQPGLGMMAANGAARTKPDCAWRTMRGGAWYNEAAYVRLSSRWANPEPAAGNGVGFRVARDSWLRQAKR